MLKSLLVEELKTKSYDEIAKEMLKESGTSRERLFCNYMGFAHCNAGSGVDGVNWNTLSFVEVKTQYYNPNTKGDKKLTAKGMWGSITKDIYEKKCRTNEETYVIGFTENADIAFYFLFNFENIKDEYKTALERKSNGLTLSYKKFIKGDYKVFVNPQIEKYEHCISPALYKFLTDDNPNSFNEHIHTTKGKIPLLKKCKKVTDKASSSSNPVSHSPQSKLDAIKKAILYLNDKKIPLTNKAISIQTGIRPSTVSKYWQNNTFIKN